MFVRHLIHVIETQKKCWLINMYIEGQKCYKKQRFTLWWFSQLVTNLRRPNLRGFHCLIRIFSLIHAMSYDVIHHRQSLTCQRLQFYPVHQKWDEYASFVFYQKRQLAISINFSPYPQSMIEGTRHCFKNGNDCQRDASAKSECKKKYRTFFISL